MRVVVLADTGTAIIRSTMAERCRMERVHGLSVVGGESQMDRDAENSYLNLEGDEDPMQQVLGCSVSYRIAVGPQQGRKVFTLQTIPAREEDSRSAQVAKASGFSLHAGVVAQDWERQKPERLCRYISRPAVSEKRLSLTPNGNIRYRLKTPYNDRTTHVIFEPLNFISRLAVLVPKPRVNLTRLHGVFAPNSKHRVDVMPAKRAPVQRAKKNTRTAPPGHELGAAPEARVQD